MTGPSGLSFLYAKCCITTIPSSKKLQLSQRLKVKFENNSLECGLVQENSNVRMLVQEVNLSLYGHYSLGGSIYSLYIWKFYEEFVATEIELFLSFSSIFIYNFQTGIH